VSCDNNNAGSGKKQTARFHPSGDAGSKARGYQTTPWPFGMTLKSQLASCLEHARTRFLAWRMGNRGAGAARTHARSHRDQAGSDARPPWPWPPHVTWPCTLTVLTAPGPVSDTTMFPSGRSCVRLVAKSHRRITFAKASGRCGFKSAKILCNSWPPDRVKSSAVQF
jgi:hypothetical protein